MVKPYLSVVIPAFNEELRIIQTLDYSLNYLKNQNYPFEIIVVNDGSTDKTKEVVQNFINNNSNYNLKIIGYDKNRGKGYAVNYGMTRALGEIVLFMDADNSTKINEVEKAFKKIDEGFDIVIASRKLKESKIIVYQSLMRRILGNIFPILVKILFNLNLTDTQAGFKVFKKETLIIFQEQKIFDFAFDVELLVIAKKHNFKIAEIPIVWENQKFSKVKFSSTFKMFFSLLKIKFNNLNSLK
jgi:dolichyl-phosphate beta-glucosyltransferase